MDREQPDLILLDVMMPEMDGIEVCRRIQSHPIHKTVPVIFITARSSKEGKLAGLGVGAVDYITKPIDLDETVARVNTQLRVVQVNREMLDLQRRLQETRRTAAVGAITQGIAHNLNNLLGVVLGYLDLIRVNYAKPEAVRANAEHLDAAVQRIVLIIRQLSSLVVKSRLPTAACPLDDLVSSTLQRFHAELREETAVTVVNPLGNLPIQTHVEMFEDCLMKLLTNAYESYGEDFTGPRRITLRTSVKEAAPEVGGRLLVMQFEDLGRGIDPQLRDHLFEPFISGKNTVGVGMGLSVARHSLRNMGGDLTLADNPAGGVIAILTHPVESQRRTLISS
jgi:signal transduction histidine kinase